MRAGEKVRWPRALEDLSSNPLHLHLKNSVVLHFLNASIQTEIDDHWKLPAASLPLGSVRDTVVKGTGQKVTAQDTQHFSLACTPAHTHTFTYIQCLTNLVETPYYDITFNLNIKYISGC